MNLLAHLAAWKPFTALVVGDVMLDRLTFGDVDRLCNDAPVPVLAVSHTQQRAGGTANVCLDLVAMHGRVEVLGVVGNDEAAEALRAELIKHKVGVAGLVVDPSRPTTVKQSLIGLAQHRHAQKMFRLDYESKAPISASVEDALIAAFAKAVTAADIVCIEDYAKGVCTERLCREVIAMSKQHGKPVFVDPAAITDYRKYTGATVMTPNRSEAEIAARMLGVQPESQAAEHYGPVAAVLAESIGLEALVITLDKHGALLHERGAEARVVPTVARQIYDVTGAGDMVLAALAAARANGVDWYDSVRLANVAAGLEVEQVGVVPIPLEAIHRDVLQREHATIGKRRTVQQLQVELKALRSGSKPAKVVLANGCFDVLHAGHVSLLRRAAELGDYLVVAINDDASVRKLKGPERPIYNVDDRALLLGELGCVAAVVVFGEDTPEQLIQAISPDVLVKGNLYDPDTVPGAAFVKSRGGTVAMLDVVPGRSTTGTVAKIKSK